MVVEPLVEEFIRSRYPPDAVQIAGYHESVEVFRNTKLLRETDGAYFTGTVDKINGSAHTQRRRVLNPAFGQEPVAAYRAQILLPTLERALDEVQAQQPPRADLPVLAERIFLQFAAALVGIEDASDPARSEELLRFYRTFSAAEGYKHMVHQDRAVLDAARDATQHFVERFLAPSLAAVERRGADDGTLMSLFAQRADPSWEDDDQLAREAIIFVIASVDTSANFLVHVVDELWRWFEAHPEDRTAPGFMKRAIEEAARLHPNLPESPRIAVEDVRLSTGMELAAGRVVLVRKNLANRDRSVFGDDADRFNPWRELPAGVPGYGIAFGAGGHKCIGTPVVVGHADELGSHAQVATRLLAAGIRPDPARPAIKAPTYIDRYESYPVLFD